MQEEEQKMTERRGGIGVETHMSKGKEACHYSFTLIHRKIQPRPLEKWLDGITLPQITLLQTSDCLRCCCCLYALAIWVLLARFAPLSKSNFTALSRWLLLLLSYFRILSEWCLIKFMLSCFYCQRLWEYCCFPVLGKAFDVSSVGLSPHSAF